MQLFFPFGFCPDTNSLYLVNYSSWAMTPVVIPLFCLQPDTITGNIVFVLQLKEHPKYKRKFDDLYVEHILSLSEALCGFQFALTHLDGRQLLVKSNPGEVIKPGNILGQHSFIIVYIFVSPKLVNISSKLLMDWLTLQIPTRQ